MNSSGMSRVAQLLSTFSGFSKNQPLLFDCGSTVTRVFFEGKLLAEEPTCIAVHAESGSTVAVGAKAVSLLGKVSDKFQVEFPIAHGEISSPSLLQKFLEVVVSKFDTTVFSKVMGFPVVLVVPSELSPVQKTIFEETFKKAGFRSVVLIPQAETLLEKLGAGGEHESFCYLDFGGQKSEFGIFTLNEKIKSMTVRTGGVQLTEIIQEHIRLVHNLEVSWHVAEQVKREACSFVGLVPGGGRVAATKVAIRGKDVVTQAGKTVTVSSADFLESFGFVVEELIDALQFFFASVPAHLVASSLEDGIFMTGGMSQMTGLKELLEHTFSSPVYVHKHPDLDSIEGLHLRVSKHEI